MLGKKTLFTVQHFFEGGNVDNLTSTIVQSLMYQGTLTKKEIGTRFICFNVHGSFLQGNHTKMTFQLKEKYYPYMMGQYCMTHTMNLDIQLLSNVSMLAKLEKKLQ
jgi:hypothetical protein